MRVTTFGVTHKVLIDKEVTSKFLKKEENEFSKLNNFKKIIYDKDTVVSDTSLNYLNRICENPLDESLKNIILKEYYDCEKIYPYLGDYFLFKLFETKINTKKSSKFSKKNEEEFLNSVKTKTVRSITNWIFNNINLKRSINVETHLGKEIAVEILDDCVFNCSYDYDFFNNLDDALKNYKFALINGMIESVGEIHHLLHKANQNKKSYVIFCFGMSEEVKQTIIKNNNLGRLKVYPVCLDANDENTLNILNDFAVIQGGSVISSDLGQTISQEVRKDLLESKEIRFQPGKIIIKPNVDKITVEQHKKFLKKRIDEALTKCDVKIEPLQNRLKSFTSSRLNIYLPEILLKDKKLTRELDYVLRFLSNLSKNQTKAIIRNEMFYIPTEYISISKKKLDSLKTNLSNIQAFVV